MTENGRPISKDVIQFTLATSGSCKTWGLR
jgi:hypothetical protein